MTIYLIWSFEHGGWWAAGRMGYVADVARAGQYELDEAMNICLRANIKARDGIINEGLVPLPEAPPQRTAGFTWERRGKYIVITDLWVAGSPNPTVGNDAAKVVADLRHRGVLVPGRRIVFRDGPTGLWDEMIIDTNCRLICFANHRAPSAEDAIIASEREEVIGGPDTD